MTRPMLDSLELAQVQRLEVQDAEALSCDRVPAAEGDQLQVSGRRSARVQVQGVLTGPSAAGDLKTLRETFRAASPVPFTADIGAATQLDRVVIEALAACEVAGKPARVEYVLFLREHVPAPPTVQQTAQQLPGPLDQSAEQDAAAATQVRTEQVAGQRGRLDVRLETGSTGIDYAAIVVRVDGTGPDGAPFSMSSDQPTDGIYTFADVAAGSYQVRAELR